ncbi:hypothetical protein N9X53_05360 [Mariniblastus sp.]|nr:hypothetical protein [Mariniblastus sp.]
MFTVSGVTITLWLFKQLLNMVDAPTREQLPDWIPEWLKDYCCQP